MATEYVAQQVGVQGAKVAVRAAGKLSLMMEVMLGLLKIAVLGWSSVDVSRMSKAKG